MSCHCRRDHSAALCRLRLAAFVVLGSRNSTCRTVASFISLASSNEQLRDARLFVDTPDGLAHEGTDGQDLDLVAGGRFRSKWNRIGHKDLRKRTGLEAFDGRVVKLISESY